MQLITVNKDNLAREHICCAIANEKDVQVSSKKAWLKERFDDGLVFLKGDVRGKCFIEYIPAEMAWAPVEAPGYMYIDCFWVSGQYKGQGNANLLLSACIEDSREKGKKGLAVLSSPKKMPFLSDPKYLRYKGFRLADTAEPYYELLYLSFAEETEAPRFKACAKKPYIEEEGFVLYYTNQCPYTAKYVPVLEEIAKAKGIPFKAVRFTAREQAQNAPVAFTTYALFCDGGYITNEILSEKKFEKLAEERYSS